MSLISPEGLSAGERIRLVPFNTLTVSPGQCIVCGYSNTDRRYVDPQIDVEFYGAFFFCELCVAQMAILFDWATPDQVLMLQAEITELDDHVTLARAQVERQQEIINGLQRIPSTLQDVKSIGSTQSEFSLTDTIFNQADEPANSIEQQIDSDAGSEGPDINVGSEAATEFLRSLTASSATPDEFPELNI